MRNITSSVATFLTVSGITEYWSGVLWSLSLGIPSKSCQFRPQLPIVKKRGLLSQLFASIKTCSLQTTWVWMPSWYEELLLSSGRWRLSEGARKTVPTSFASSVEIIVLNVRLSSFSFKEANRAAWWLGAVVNFGTTTPPVSSLLRYHLYYQPFSNRFRNLSSIQHDTLVLVLLEIYNSKLVTFTCLFELLCLHEHDKSKLK